MVDRCGQCVIVAVVCLLLGVIGLCVICGVYYVDMLSKKNYGVVFDAGLSHTSMYVYDWDSAKVNGTAALNQISTCKTQEGGLLRFTEKPFEAGDSLETCLNEATDAVPFAIKQYSPVYLGITPDMQLFRPQDHVALNDIIESIRIELASSAFLILDIKQQAKVLSGRETGVDLWITVNYVAGTIGVSKIPKLTVLPAGNSTTLGCLDMNAISTQVAFELAEDAAAPSNQTTNVMLYGENVRLFSQYILCFGLAEMNNQVLAILAKKANYKGTVDHPCYPVGYRKSMTYTEIFQSACTGDYISSSSQNTVMTIHGTGNNEKCEAVIADLFTSSSFFNSGTLMPAAPDRFLAKGGFAFIMQYLKVVNDKNVVNYREFVSAMKSWCEQSYKMVMKTRLYNPLAVCTESHFIRYLLIEIYKLSEDWSGIIFTDKLNNMRMEWTLGYLTNITTYLPPTPKLKLYNISTPVFGIIMAITIVLIIVGAVATLCACRYQEMKYQKM